MERKRPIRSTKPTSRKPVGRKPIARKTKPATKPTGDPDVVRLNRYIASSGICSRREADTFISAGIITVNGKVVKELGTKISKSDVVKMGGDSLKMEKHYYVLLNKPKDYITTSKDPRNRKTVMELIRKACKERILPVGRLDRNTSGLLLFTNDGNLAKKLTHPSSQCEKLYHVFLNRPLKFEHLEMLRNGMTLEDGTIKADEANYVGNGKDKKQAGLKMHSGRNRIVRRMFEHMGYKVIKLDRVMFAGLTKKDLSRGQWRHLSEMELRALQKID